MKKNNGKKLLAIAPAALLLGLCVACNANDTTPTGNTPAAGELIVLDPDNSNVGDDTGDCAPDIGDGEENNPVVNTYRPYNND